MSEPRVTTLDNGLRILTDAMPGMSSVSLGVWVGVGSRYETEDLGGISHFLEHLLFKGTRTRSAKQITEEIEGVGGSMNAFTSEEHTCYTVKIHPKRTDKGLEILSDMLLHSELEPKEVERERDVICEEMNLSRDNPGEFVQELVTALVWPRHPLGRLIIGSARGIRGMRRAHILDFKKTHYVAQNMVVVGAGNVQQKEFVAMVKRWFGEARSGPVPHYQRVNGSLAGPRANVFAQKTQQTHIALAFPGCDRVDPRRAALRVLNVVLGANMSSRLFQEVREKKGFAYDIGSSLHHHHDTGTLVIYAGTEAKKLSACLRVITDVLRNFAKRGATADELRKAKEYAIGGLTLSLEKTMDRMLWLGEHLISTGRLPEQNKITRQIEGVTMAEVTDLAKKIFQPGNLCAQAIGQGLSKAKLLGFL